MEIKLIKGLIAPILTPFDNTLKLDQKMYNDLVLEKQSLRIKCKFLNKYENDDDEHVYHIVRGAIWYTPSADVKNKRWNEILGKMVLDGESHGLSEEFVLKLFKAIHQESINHQEKVIVK